MDVKHNKCNGILDISINNIPNTERRLTMKESMEIRKESPHSVEFSITSKGLWSGKVKAYADTPQQAMGEALLVAEKINMICKSKNRIGVDMNGKLK